MTVRTVSAELSTPWSRVRWCLACAWTSFDTSENDWWIENNVQPKHIRMFFFFVQVLNPSYLCSQISRPSKKWRRHEEKSRNSKELSVSPSVRFIPKQYTAAGHCIWDWAYWVQYLGQKWLYWDPKSRTVTKHTPASQLGVPGSISSLATLGRFEYFGFLSFHEYSITVYSLITEDILLKNW